MEHWLKMKSLGKKNLILVGVIILSMVFLVVPFLIEPEDGFLGGGNNFIEINEKTDESFISNNFDPEEEEFDLEDEFDEDEFDGEIIEYAVYISGEVKTPGVYYLEPGSRVYEVIREAGGALDNARLDHINLAAKIVDGEHIHIPSKDDELQKGEKTSGSSTGEQDDSFININEADALNLEELPGIGPARAETIVDYREREGKFSNIEDIMNVPGIGTGIFEQIRERITT